MRGAFGVGPFEGKDCEEFLNAQTITMRAGPGEHFAVYQKPKIEELSDDGRVIFHFETLIEAPAE